MNHWWLSHLQVVIDSAADADIAWEGEGEGEEAGGGEEGEALQGSFYIRLQTHGHRIINISGDRHLFSDPTRMATEGEIQQLVDRIIYALNTTTGELEATGELE